MPTVSDLPLAETVPARLPGWVFGVALLVGVGLFTAAQDVRTHPQYVTIALAAAVTLMPRPARMLNGLLDRIRGASRRAQAVTTVLVFVGAAAYLRYAAWLGGREFHPCFHDEFMYLLQARMMSEGHLWLPQHPLADFFDAFFVVVRPVYASSYFPGTAMAYVPGMWLGLAPWVTAWVVTSLAVAMLYRVVTDLVDGVAGLLAAGMALSLEDLRIAAFMTMSHMVMLLILLVAVAAYVRWRRNRRIGWAVVLGVCAGWGAITRPMDAICFILPLIALMLWDLRRGGARRAVLTIVAVSLAAVPFIALELVFDKGVTGRWLKAPVTLYNDVNLPGHSMGLAPGAHLPPSPSHLQQVRDYHVEMVESYLRLRARAGFFETWFRDRLLPSADVAFPAHALFILLPLGLLAVPRRSVVAALLVGLILLPLAYTFWTSFFAHYGLILLPAFYALALLGAGLLRATFPPAGGAIALSILLLALGGLPVVKPNLDRYPRSDMLLDVERKLAGLDHVPAVVLFRYESGGSSIHEEPVYNIDAGWPDDERVIRAHDLGPRNVEIFSHYAARQPERFFYRYDRTTHRLTRLGRAGDLVK